MKRLRILRDNWNLKNNQMPILKLKNAASEIKKSLDGFNRTIDMAKERISELEDSSVENIHPGADKEKREIHKTTQNMRLD